MAREIASERPTWESLMRWAAIAALGMIAVLAAMVVGVAGIVDLVDGYPFMPTLWVPATGVVFIAGGLAFAVFSCGRARDHLRQMGG